MLVLKNVTFGYNGRPIIEDVTIECRPGEICGVLGGSGVGKTTLLNIAAGTLQCATGHVAIDGMPPVAAARAQKIGYVFQAATLEPWHTVAQCVSLPLELHSKPADVRERAALVRQTLERTHIGHAADKYAHELSGGMQARASIARAIVYRPNVLLLDEPFNGVDDLVKENFIYPELQELLATEKMATLLVTHNLNEAILLCTRVFVLRAENNDGPSRIVHVEDVQFPRPRTIDLYENSEFLAAHRRIREHLC